MGTLIKKITPDSSYLGLKSVETEISSSGLHFAISDAFVDIVTITIKAIVVELLDHDSDLCDNL